MSAPVTHENLDIQRSNEILKEILSTQKGRETLLHSSSEELGMVPRKNRRNG